MVHPITARSNPGHGSEQSDYSYIKSAPRPHNRRAGAFVGVVRCFFFVFCAREDGIGKRPCVRRRCSPSDSQVMATAPRSVSSARGFRMAAYSPTKVTPKYVPGMFKEQQQHPECLSTTQAGRSLSVCVFFFVFCALRQRGRRRQTTMCALWVFTMGQPSHGHGC